MITNTLLALGVTRDSLLLLWGRWLSLLTLVANQAFDLHTVFASIGVPIGTVGINRIMLVVVAILWLSGRYSESPLPGSSSASSARRTLPMVLLPLMLVCGGLSLAACAATTAHDRVRVAALTIGDAVIGIDEVERGLADAQLPEYDAAAQRKVSPKLVEVARAARAYERVARALQPGGGTPQQVDDVLRGLTTALDDLEHVLPASERVRVPIQQAIGVLRQLLPKASASRSIPAPLRAQLPAGIMGILSLAQLLASLISSGRTTVAAVKADLQKHGATDEELDRVDGGLTEIIERREAAQGQG
jgi:hypothetical protein